MYREFVLPLNSWQSAGISRAPWIKPQLVLIVAGVSYMQWPSSVCQQMARSVLSGSMYQGHNVAITKMFAGNINSWDLGSEN